MSLNEQRVSQWTFPFAEAMHINHSQSNRGSKSLVILRLYELPFSGYTKHNFYFLNTGLPFVYVSFSSSYKVICPTVLNHSVCSL